MYAHVYTIYDDAGAEVVIDEGDDLRRADFLRP